MTNFLTNVGIVAAVVIVFVMACCCGIVWFGHQFLFDRMNAVEMRVTRVREELAVLNERMDVLVTRLGGEPTRSEDGMPSEDFWPMTPEEFEEWQRKLREEIGREKTEQNTQP